MIDNYTEIIKGEINSLNKDLKYLDLHIKKNNKNRDAEIHELYSMCFENYRSLINVINLELDSIIDNINKCKTYSEKLKGISTLYNVIDESKSYADNKKILNEKYHLYCKRFKHLTLEHKIKEYNDFLEFANLQHIKSKLRDNKTILDRYSVINIYLELEPSTSVLKHLFNRDHTTLIYARENHDGNLKYYEQYEQKFNSIGRLFLHYIYTQVVF